MRKETNNNKISDKAAGKQNRLSETEIINEKVSFRKFNSFEEMNEADAQSAANINSLEHLKNATELIKLIYTEEMKNPFDKKIIFR